MTLSTLDPTTALIVVDLQNSVTTIPVAPHSADVVVENSRRLLDAFRARGLPVVLVNVDGRAPGRTEGAPRPAASAEPPADPTGFVARLDRRESDHVVTKRTWGAFTRTDLETHLRSLGVTQVVVTGIATTAGVESTARQAHEAGFHVALATDAMTDMSAEAHENSVTRIFPRLGETGTTDEILALLEVSEH
ncbi:hydrolase [Frondihabitans sucicola]|uniref:Hydrolase n=1 Tax=Frondihabitans sucicola TaxID=1268041 RepID=A0ABM8GSV7_9MICO|nr:isochorismatase family protein [Frondihabitans sucicola]BDZ51559.1 hydrolase [Frondihabitans sucicola]